MRSSTARASPSPPPPAPVLPAVAFDGTNYLVVWRPVAPEPVHDIYRGAGEPGRCGPRRPGISISTAANSQSRRRWLSTAPTTWWCGRTDRSERLRTSIGARVSRAGAVLDGSGIAISTAANDQSAPAVAFDGTNYLVVWQDRRTDRLRHLRGAGEPGRCGPRPLGHRHLRPPPTTSPHRRWLSTGTNYLVVWAGRPL